MGFVTVICLVVAAYFLWEALKDKKNADLASSVSTAHRMDTNSPATPAANYKNTRTPAHPVSSAADKQSTLAAQDQHEAQPSSLIRDSANDSNVGNLVGAAVAAVGVAGAAGAVASDNSKPADQATSDTGTGRLVNGKLRFLNGPIGRKDDLTHIDGVGPVIEEGLNGVGIYHYHQIANFTETDVVNIDTELGFPGRVNREDWVGQARKLSSVTLESSVMEASGDQLDTAIPSALTNGIGGGYVGDAESVLTDADYTGVWNTDVMIEVQERLKVLNTRISDAPRLQMTRDEYTAIKANEDEALSRDRLLEILERLRELDQ